MNNTYQLAIDHIEKLLDRRQATTTFYLSVNTAISAAIGLIINNNQLAGWWLVGALLLLIATGIMACIIWRSLLYQYRIMLGWWYQQLRNMEATMPESARLFTREYQELIVQGKDKKEKSEPRVGLTSRELALNWVFMGLYITLGISIISTSFWK